jgi:predicted Ser/Thr protein kinase
MAAPAFDIPALAERVAEIVPTYTAAKNETIDPEIKESPLFIALRPFLRGLILNISAKDESYWRASGVRMVPRRTFAECMARVKNTARELGAGYYGKVLNVPSNPCFENLPAAVKHVGLKIENLKGEFDANQTPDRLKEVIAIAKKAGELGIGPQLYDVFITIGADGIVQIIKLFELIDGVSWEKTEWGGPLKKTEALDKLNDAIHIMNKAGIIHHDLHSGNVMVSRTGEVYIIDYDMAKFVDNEEADALESFKNDLVNRWNPKGVASNNGIAYVYQKLLAEGTIKLTAGSRGNGNAAAGNANAAARGNGKGNAQTRKAKKA